MSSDFTPADAANLHNTLVRTWSTHGPNELWETVQQLDPGVLAYLVMMNVGRDAIRHG